MISVGFKELIEKCEEYYGKGATKAVIGVVALCGVVAALGLAVSTSIYPLSLWIAGILTGQPVASQALQGMGSAVTFLWSGIAVGALLAFIRMNRSAKTLRKAHEEITRRLDRAEKVEAAKAAKKEQSALPRD